MKRLTLVLLLSLSLKVAMAQTTYDICIYGGTSAGVIAAYTAKMNGKSVLLIEPSRRLGGLSSGGLGQTDIGNKYAVTGLARDFYRRIGQHYGKFEQWTFEPHVALNLFQQYISRAKVEVWYDYRLFSVKKQKGVIEEIVVENAIYPESKTNRTIRAKVFIDCTYEGDLMAKAGVSYTVGREANSLYGETWNGVQMLDKHQFPKGISPYRIPGDSTSGLLWGISEAPLLPNGSGDKSVQAYNFRICLTNNPENRIAITRPPRYDSTKYELLLRQVAIEKPAHINWGVLHIADMPNQKTDINNKGGLSTDMIGMNFAYPEADYETRQQIIQEHLDYTKGFLYFVGHDPRMPVHLREQMLEWGYPKDEYLENDHFTPQLYIREARRMIGEYVMTQHNCENREVVPDGIAMAAYSMDSHNCQRLIVKDPDTGEAMVQNEGDVQVHGFHPYPISYRSLVPKRTECTNLLVPVCHSASHIAYGSIRMEPVFMALGQAAAAAAVLSLNGGSSVQEISVEDLQRSLVTNPLADGSRPEILLDNDVTPDAVHAMGEWKKSTEGGKYARTQLVDESKGADRKSVRFIPSIPAQGRYAVYIFNPYPGGGGGNPAQYDGKTTGKSSKTKIEIQALKTQKVLTLPTQTQVNEWIKVDTFEFVAGTDNYIELSNEGADGIVVADAILLIPVE
ncbi:FAD-dependent oxidoreductase [Arundinibacter roseus]|uniref:FAD-dependent oxidoreductase n=1 Tax=Arundinibacter roseus TaxID=2070510 RepID=A0A4R4KB10_9BACT|nr:FAD-dependent oxidoreductase [Arundinibacter roseus]TDB63611.1 FAD-dependent oxidoreductase [Arundinibacter roseus]